MRIVIIGGGVVGLCCAREIARCGGEVTLVEKNCCGGATSLRNAGQIVPSLCTPLASPGVMKQALRWLVRRDSPLGLRVSPDPEYLGWLLRFALNASEEKFRECLKAALALGRDTHLLFEELRKEGVEFEMHKKGMLFATLSEETLREDVEIYRKLERAGYEGQYEVLSGEEARRIEPSLSKRVVGGIFVKEERHVRPESLMRGLVADLRSRGVQILEGTEVYGLKKGEGGTWRVLTPEGELDADRVLVAAGVWSKELLAQLGVRIPLEAGKGYSVTSVGTGTPPERPLKFAEAQVVATPYEGGVRISGRFELSGIDLSLQRRKIDSIIRAASPYLRDWRPEKPRLEWVGLRPATPDSLPLIGKVPNLPNLYLATGHGMLGLTHAPATAKAITPLILEERMAPELKPFNVGRISYNEIESMLARKISPC
ncbi:D-amino acid dehydrogenase small subunit [Rubrobacter xylanophilus DSM 9941]|uniref:D-amino acid dehydrogenase small subunit n=1 Tax=Rubrobacter xylanophilus (strain DSM 9941 / JCM 11954 / NBRC 16129 / PRD-1) TaxID=266117 RepID=Q1ATU2_RUBXD|nr:FAD-dependent oxidoreductase [Rubrobacter xylanophilus]ABG05186.1 D-amino acid dehydrogenase small subunit [Rubrobacter xylanophilus DSM 9941]